MRLIIGQDAIIADWVSRQTGKPFHPPFKAIGVGDGQQITGGFVFTGYNGDGIELSLAGRGVVNRTAWIAVLIYVFQQLQCSRLQMHTSMANKPVRKYLARLFPPKEFPRFFEAINRRFYGDKDAACYALTIDDLPKFRKKWRLD